jgi:hypothetical protein
MNLTSCRRKWCGDGASSSETGVRVCWMIRDSTRQQQQSTILPGPRPLQSSDFHFFPTLKRTLEGRRFATNEDVEAVVQTQDTDFYQQGFFKLVKRWDKCINVGADYVDKYPTNVPFRPYRCVSRPCGFLQMAD